MTTAPLVVTLGDPAGIGPEILAKAHQRIGQEVPIVAVGDLAALERALAARGAPPPRPIASLDDATCGARLEVMDVPCPQPVRPGLAETGNAAAIIESIARATALVQSGAGRALVTCPINKKVLVDGAAFPHPGHTEFLAHLDGAGRSVMMLAGPGLRVVPVTIHVPISAVPTLLTADLLTETIEITLAALRRDFGLPAPRLAVAGLNPHAGEGGMMGHEDGAVIAPVVAAFAARGIAVSGPLSADTMFHPAARARFDAAICMYHDQALIPLKTLAFSEGVNTTLGLSFIRTSPDHGTAYDIAGTGQADPDSLIAALVMARDMAANRAEARV